MPEIELWKIFASLGIPGFALGVFYMLFRRFKWKFSKVPRIWGGPIIILFMLLSSGLTFYALTLWAPSSDVAAVRITVLGLDNMPVENSEIRSSIGGETKKVNGGWELEIAESKLPDNRKIIIYANQNDLKGQSEISVVGGKTTTASIQLKQNSSAQTKDSVPDAKPTKVSTQTQPQNNIQVEQQTEGDQSPTIKTDEGDVTINYGDTE